MTGLRYVTVQLLNFWYFYLRNTVPKYVYKRNSKCFRILSRYLYLKDVRAFVVLLDLMDSKPKFEILFLQANR